MHLAFFIPLSHFLVVWTMLFNLSYFHGSDWPYSLPPPLSLNHILTVITLKRQLGPNMLIRSNEMQQYAGVYLLHNYSTCFGYLSHPSSGVHQTVTAASGTGHITFQSNNLPPAWPIGHDFRNFMFCWKYETADIVHRRSKHNIKIYCRLAAYHIHHSTDKFP